MQSIVSLIFMYLQLINVDAIIIMACTLATYLTIQSQLLAQAKLRSMCDKIKVFKLYLNTMKSICICIKLLS